jgi:hypothetical protein
MQDSSNQKIPKTQTGASGGPPKPPKKTTRALGDDSSDPSKRLSASEKAELKKFLEKLVRKQK